DAYIGNTGDLSIANGHVYANKAPALSWLASIPYFIVHTIFGTPGNALALGVAAYMATLFSVGIFAALIPALLYLEARRRGVDATWAASVALMIAFATELLPYSTLMMVAVPSGALMLIAYTSRRDALAGFAAGLAAAMNYVCVPAIVILAIPRGGQAPSPVHGTLGQARRLSSTGKFIVGAAIPLIGLAIYQRICFSSYFTNSVAKSDPRFLANNAAFGVLGKPSLEALYGITISPYRGLFFFAPLLLMALVPLLREKIILAISIIFIAFNVCFNGWEGGLAIGARYLVPLIPLWGIALMRARPRAIVIALAAISFTLNFTATVVDPQPSGTLPLP